MYINLFTASFVNEGLEVGGDLAAYAGDYCEGLKEAVGSKMDFLKELSNLDPEGADFMSECL